MDAETAALFPDAFEDSELGEIPRGWRVVRLPEVIEVNPNRSLKQGQVAPYHDMANMPTQDHRAMQWILRPFSSGTRFQRRYSSRKNHSLLGEW
jgi:type I restriction enzyme S subunit